MPSKSLRDRTQIGLPRNRPRGVFIVGTDTEVGKTTIACWLAKLLVASGIRVGVYKPVASGCQKVEGELVSEDALALWNAAGGPCSLAQVCPQMFAAPLAPNLAAQQEGKRVDTALLSAGAAAWQPHCDFLIVEGAGGYFSPLSDDLLVADLALQLKLPIVLVASNRLGAINQALTAAHAINTYGGGLPLLHVILNDATPTLDSSTKSNFRELWRHLAAGGLAKLPHNASLDVAKESFTPLLNSLIWLEDRA